MGVTKGRGGPWAATVLTLVMVITLFPFSNRAAALLPDLTANGSSVVSSRTGMGGCSSGWSTNGHDGDDTTTTGTCSASGNDSYAVNFTASQSVRYIQWKGTISGGSFTDFLVTINVGSTCVWNSRSPSSGLCGSTLHGSGGWGTGTHDTGVIDLGSPVSGTSVSYTIFMVGSGATSTALYTFAAWGSDPTAPQFTDYVMNLTVHKALFSKWFTWQWVDSFTGSWYIERDTDSKYCSFNCSSSTRDHTAGYTESDLPYGQGGSPSAPMDPCGIGGCSGWTIHLNVNGVTGASDLTYHIDDDAEGTLIDAITAPVIGLFQLTYVASTDTATYLLAWGPEDTTADWCIGQRGENPLYNPIDSCLASDTGVTASVGETETGTFTVSTGTTVFVARVTNSMGTVFRTVDLGTFGSDGGAQSVAPLCGSTPTPGCTPNPTVVEQCSFADVACAVRNIGASLKQALSDILDMGVEAFMAAWDAIYGVISQKQPFAFIGDAVGNLVSRIADFNEEVSSTGTCPGYVVVMPTLPPITYTAFGAEHTANPRYYAYASGAPTATPFAVTALKCSDFEPTLGSTTWQSIRTMLGPVIFALYGWKLVREFGPKIMLTG